MSSKFSVPPEDTTATDEVVSLVTGAEPVHPTSWLSPLNWADGRVPKQILLTVTKDEAGHLVYTESDPF